MKTLNDFLFEYDSGDLKFNTLQYRKGAKITAPFGITDGYQVIEGKVIFGQIPRIHTGVDRSYHNNSGLNVILAPFDFNRTEYHDYGDKNEYGSVMRLFNDSYGFEMRVMHIFPEDIPSQVMSILKQKGSIKYNTILGKAGSYGIFNAKHTHTEVVSLNKTCKVLDDLLELKYREDAFLNYTEEEVLSLYKQYPFWKNERRDNLIIDDYQKQVEKRHIVNNQLNEFKFTYLDWYSGNKERTRYSSSLLFNGL